MAGRCTALLTAVNMVVSHFHLVECYQAQFPTSYFTRVTISKFRLRNVATDSSGNFLLQRALAHLQLGSQRCHTNIPMSTSMR
ncbi:hypothetical protein C8R48DRAFT_725195 [Suillus tomentosus]|nr:hypothetical protein C8R48DRAFT_725195 [Suillus tomentosus]